MGRFREIAAGVLCGWMAAACVAQMPAGAHSADDHSQQDAAMAQTAAEMRAAETALEQGDYKTAEAKLTVLAAANPKNAQVLFDLGYAQERNGEDDAAAKSYAAAVEADGTMPEPRLALALSEARAGKTDAAHKDFLTVAVMQTAAPALRGQALRGMAMLDEEKAPAAAQEELLDALKLTPETPRDTQMAAELAERAGDAGDAEGAYRKVLTARPGDVDATVGLAHVLEQQKKDADAEQVLSAGLKEHPHDPRLMAQMGLVQANEGKPEAAIAMLEAARKDDAAVASDAALSRELARLYSMAGDEASAATLYKALAAAAPNDGPLLDDLGGAEVKLGQYAEAETALAKAVALRASFPKDEAWGEAAGHLAFASSKNNHPRVTLQALTERATVLPNSPASLFLEATAHDSLHETKEAARAYKAFLAVADGKYPDQEFQARHRLVALQQMR